MYNDEMCYFIERVSVPLYHLSPSNLDGKTLKPRIPSNSLTRDGYEDSKTPRVSLARSIDLALLAISNNLEGKKFYVHQVVNNPKVTTPSIRQVPDIEITKEIWATGDVELKCIGYIVVGKAIDRPLQYTLGNKIVDAYMWNYSKYKIK